MNEKEGQDMFSWADIIREAGGHHDENADGRDSINGVKSDWTLTEFIDDIEQQMGEQNDALAGMTKRLQDIEMSLSRHDAVVGMPTEASPASSARGTMLVVKLKSFLKKRQDKCPKVGADDSTQSGIDLAVTSSSTTRQAGEGQANISERTMSVLKSGAKLRGVDAIATIEASTDDRLQEQPGQIAGPSAKGEEKEDEILSPPRPLDRQVTFVTSPTDEAFYAPPKPFPSCATMSATSNTESVVSDFEETISGKTWRIRSRGAKMTVVCMLLSLVLMLGLVIGQFQGGGRSSQQAAATTITPVAEPTEAPASAPVVITEAPASVPVVITEPTLPTGEATEAPEAPLTPAPTEPEEEGTDVPTEDTLTGYDYRANTDYLVGVYYYPWHGDNFHNNGGYMRQDLQPPHQPTLGEYNDSDPAVIAQHMRWFRKANIGLLVTSWWGPDRLEDTITKDVIMEHEDIGNLKIAIHYETTGRLGNGLDDVSNAKTDVEYMCENYFDHPNYYKIDGRPVVFIYISRVLYSRGILEEALLTMRSAGSKCGHDIYLIGDSVFESAPDPNVPHVPFWYFDAVTNYDVYGSAGRPEGFVGTERVDTYYSQQAGWREQALQENCHYIPAVSPGYNDRGVRMENNHPPLSRRITSTAQEGSLFHYQLGHAKLLADERVDRMILVNSFNEWHEDTQIEPAVGEPSTVPFEFTQGLEYVGYGELYLDILGAATSRDTSQHTVFDYLLGP